MLKFQVQVEEKPYYFEIAKMATIAELKTMIANELRITAKFDLYIFDQLLLDEGTVNRILYNQNTDHLQVKFKEKLHLKQFQSFFKQAIPLIQFKTGVCVYNFVEKLNSKNKNKVAKMISFIGQAAEIIKQKTADQFNNFNTKIQGQTAISHIKPNEEDLVRNPNNDTVLNILDDMKELDERVNHRKRTQKSEKKKYKTPKLSPKQEEYLIRKQKAIVLLKDPMQYEKAKQLVKEMKKQKELNNQKKQEQYDRSAEKIELSIEHHKQERDFLIQKLTQDKRNKIVERLLENQKSHYISLEFNKQSQLQITELKNKIKRQQDLYKSKDDQLKQMYLEEAKLKLQEKKKQAQPIRLSELNHHEENYLQNKEMLKLQRDQKKLEWEIKIKSETKQIYRDQKVLQEVLKEDQELKNKELSEQRKKHQYKIRKQKYSEIIQEFHRPANQSIDYKNSVDDLSYSREKNFKQMLRYHNKSQIAGQLVNPAIEKNIKKIQSALSQQHITPKTKITENLQQGKVPDPSTYFHLRVHTPQKLVIQDSNQKKPKDYLREFERERRSLHNPDNSALLGINKKMNPKEHYRYWQKLEEEAQKKEKLAKVCQDEDLQIEATDLYLKSVQAKLQFLDKNLSHF